MPLEWDPQSKIWRQKQMEETNGTEVEMGRGERGGGQKAEGQKDTKVPLLGDNRIKHILSWVGAFVMWSREERFALSKNAGFFMLECMEQ